MNQSNQLHQIIQDIQSIIESKTINDEQKDIKIREIYDEQKQKDKDELRKLFNKDAFKLIQKYVYDCRSGIEKIQALINPPILAISTVVVYTHENNIKIDYPNRKRRRLSPGGQDEEVKEASLARKNEGCLIRCNRGDELFRWVLNKKGLTSTSIQNDIISWQKAWRKHHQRLGLFEEYWISQGKRSVALLNFEDLELMIANFTSQLEAKDATNANQANCRSALSTLFQRQGFKKEKIDGVVLQQIMKKPQAGMNKPIKEEQIWNYDQLLKYIKDKSDQKMQLSEIEFLVHRSIVLKLPKECWKVKTAMFKGLDTSFTVIFRPLEDLSICPTQRLSFQMNKKKIKDEKLPICWLVSKKRAASQEETSKAVHIVMKICKIPTGYTVTSNRSSSMTKSTDQGPNKTEINRASRHRKGSQAVVNHYDTNLNDKIIT
ncbi:MAG: hypothetical protein EZS28_016677 [Streblomastix strix]|uniref:Uncharacterized protein n=1 Tax=Streblomastix strix TaxID=222440 RepID=A0A5J4VZX9_9EUKA|nr:MAG: hypothetical protein EZS28_016677 [Streblomastix strix]